MAMNPRLRIEEVDRMQATDVLMITKVLLAQYDALSAEFHALHTIGPTRSIQVQGGIHVLNQKVEQDRC